MSEILSDLPPSPSTASTKKTGKTVKLKTFLKSQQNADSPSQRKSLQQLQPSAHDEGKLVGKDGFVRLATQKSKTPKRKRDGDSGMPAKRPATYISKPSKKFPIYTDSTTENKRNEAGTSKKEKTAEEIAYELMAQEEIPERYWKEIAEERRVALQNTLKENEQLHLQVKDLKEENERLKVTADQAVYLAEVVQWTENYLFDSLPEAEGVYTMDLLGETKSDKEDSAEEDLHSEVSGGGSESDASQNNLMCEESRLHSITKIEDADGEDKRMENSKECSLDEYLMSERTEESTENRGTSKTCQDSDNERSDGR